VLDRFYPPAPFGSGKPEAHWIVSNPTYVGKIRWRDRLFDAIHEPLIDELTFKRAQTILRERGEDISRRRGNASDFLLSGVVRCARCGKAYVGMSARGNGGRYEYYACSGRQKHGPKACRNERLPRHKLEHAVLQQLAALYRDTDLVAEALAQAEQEAARTRPAIEQRLASVGAEIARAQQALERYYEAFEQGRLSPERCEERLSRLQARLEHLRAQHAELSLSTPDEAGQGRRPPISQPSPTNSSASSPKASRRRRRRSSAY
jgi:site-specific DNA recombinase